MSTLQWCTAGTFVTMGLQTSREGWREGIGRPHSRGIVPQRRTGRSSGSRGFEELRAEQEPPRARSGHTVSLTIYLLQSDCTHRVGDFLSLSLSTSILPLLLAPAEHLSTRGSAHSNPCLPDALDANRVGRHGGRRTRDGSGSRKERGTQGDGRERRLVLELQVRSNVSSTVSPVAVDCSNCPSLSSPSCTSKKIQWSSASPSLRPSTPASFTDPDKSVRTSNTLSPTPLATTHRRWSSLGCFA
jgi:hypothetical protein